MERGEQTESGNTTPFLAETHLLFPVMPLSITSPRRRRLSVIRNSSRMVPSSIASRSPLTTRAFYSVLLRIPGPGSGIGHPVKRVIELTPRVWKALFADHPFRSDLGRSRAPPTQSPSWGRTPQIARLHCTYHQVSPSLPPRAAIG